MPVLLNKESGLAENLGDQEASGALKSGTHEIPLVNDQGEHFSAPPDQANELIGNGYRQPSTDQLQGLLDKAKYSSTGEQIKSGLEGAAQGVLGPAAPYIEKNLFGADPKDIRGREEANPGIHTASEIAGLVGSSMLGVGEGALLEKVGAGASKLTGLGAEGAGALSKIGASATKGAVENAIYQAGDETSKFITEDPNQSAETAAAHIGISSLIGGGVGGAFGALSPLWKAANDSKVGQFIEDFKGQMKNRMENPNPVDSLVKELSDHYNTVSDMSHEVYGAKGLKAQEIEKLMPEMGPKISDQALEIGTKLQTAIEEMEKKPNSYPDRLVEKLRGDLEGLLSGIGEDKTPSQIFNAIQDVKQNLQGYSKFDKFVKPVDEAYDFVQKVKGLGHEVRTSLEDSSVWGKAADRQQAINKGFSQYLPALKDFENKFVVEVSGESKIDPGRVSTYLNQAGKDSQKVKQDMLGKYIEASEKYRDVIDKTHANLGIESPFKSSSLSSVKASLEKLSPGAKVANALVDKGLARTSGQIAGAGVGGSLGHFVGAPGIGALIGEHALGPMFSSVLPSIAKPILENISNPGALKNAIDMGVAVIKGEHLINRAAGSIFSSSGKVMPDLMQPSFASREKIKSKLDSLNADSSPLLNTGGQTGHYLPDHGAALGGVAVRATQYLNSLKPNTSKLGPLDAPRVPSKVETSKYDRAIDVSEQPMLALQSIKEGTLTPEDVMTFKTVYPNLYARVSQKLTNEMIEHTSKDHSVPYRVRMSLGLFLGQNLDSTMTPEAISAAQTVRQAQSQQPGQAPHPTSGSMNALNKIAGMYQTQGQSREARRMAKS